MAAAASPAGDFLYRFGAPMNYTGAVSDIPSFGKIWDRPDLGCAPSSIYPSANVYRGPALPGAGHILIWDNHSTNNNTLGGPSEIKEINPYVSGKTGTVYSYSPNFVRQDLAGYTYPVVNPPSMIGWGPVNASNQVVWSFKPSSPGTGNSTHISGTQRLPNGNSIGNSR